MPITRRNALLASISLAALVGGCTTASATVDATILNDIKGLIPTVNAVLVSIEMQDPSVISSAIQLKISQLETSASDALATLSTNTPVATGATALQTIDAYLNDALTTIGDALPAAAAAFPALNNYIAAYDAAAALVQDVLEPYINSLVTPATPAVAHAAHGFKFIHSHPLPSVARATLGI